MLLIGLTSSNSMPDERISSATWDAAAKEGMSFPMAENEIPIASGAALEIWAFARSPMTASLVSGFFLSASLVALETDEWIPPQRPESEVMATRSVFPPSDLASEFLNSSERTNDQKQASTHTQTQEQGKMGTEDTVDAGQSPMASREAELTVEEGSGERGRDGPVLAAPYCFAVPMARCALARRVEAITFMDCRDSNVQGEASASRSRREESGKVTMGKESAEPPDHLRARPQPR